MCYFILVGKISITMIKACYRKRDHHTFLKQFSNMNCYCTGSFRFAALIVKTGNLKVDTFVF